MLDSVPVCLDDGCVIRKATGHDHPLDTFGRLQDAATSGYHILSGSGVTSVPSGNLAPRVFSGPSRKSHGYSLRCSPNDLSETQRYQVDIRKAPF